jgi:hypothetical protein
MNPDLSQKAIDTIESLCQLGCTQVNQLIVDAKNGKDIKELAEFSHPEQDMIIDELGEIMSVYDEK